MKALFVGNSYTYYNDMPTLFLSLARENGIEFSVDSVTVGGRKIIENLDPCDESHKKIASLSQNAEYDIFFLQEHSLLPIKDYSLFEKGVTELISLVGAKRNILYATWGRKDGSPTLRELNLTSEEMCDELYKKYKTLALTLNAQLSPVGLCFKYIYSSYPTLDLYNPDLSHPSKFGSAVAAICHYHTAFGRLPESFASLSLNETEIEAIIKAIKTLNKIESSIL